MKKGIRITLVLIGISALAIFGIQIMFFGLTYKNENGRVLIGNKPGKDDLRTDGPYFIRQDKGYDVIYVKNAPNNIAIGRVEDVFNRDWQCMVDNSKQEVFTFTLQDTLVQIASEYDSPTKILVFSDIEGNFFALKNILLSNGVMDSNYKWIYENGHIVVLGDILDRGLNVTSCLWLIYKLEKEAESYGGKVHLINGNHEEMNYRGNVSYVPRKYTGLANTLGIEYRDFFASNTVWGPWMKSKNAIVKIGKTLFCHGGISAELLKFQPSIDMINNAIRSGFGKSKTELSKSHGLENFLFSPKGILWYRGFFSDNDDYKRASQADVDKICKYFEVQRIIVGHTIQEDIYSIYNGKVIGIDVQQPTYSTPGICRALLIEEGTLYRVYTNGAKHPIN